MNYPFAQSLKRFRKTSLLFSDLKTRMERITEFNI